MVDDHDLRGALGGFRPSGLDLDGAAAAVRRRAGERSGERGRPSGWRRRSVKTVVIAFVAGVAALGGGQIVAAVRDEPRVTADGTELAQLSIAELDPGLLWKVEVTQDGADTCITTSVGGGGGAYCAPHWGEMEAYPKAMYSSVPRQSDDPDRLLVVIVSPTDRTVGLIPRNHDVDPSTRDAVEVGSLDGVHRTTVKLSGTERVVWSFVLDGPSTDDGPPVEAVYLD